MFTFEKKIFLWKGGQDNLHKWVVCMYVQPKMGREHSLRDFLHLPVARSVRIYLVIFS